MAEYNPVTTPLRSNMIRPAVLALATGLLLAAAPTPPDDDFREDIEKLQGAWRGVSLEIKGDYFPPLEARSLLLRFARDTFIIEQGGQVTVRGTFTLNATQKPRTIDLVITETVQARNKATTVLGVYELGKGTLKLCTTKANGPDRPKKLASKAGSTHTLFTFVREKP